jgi:hypothetical protein
LSERYGSLEELARIHLDALRLKRWQLVWLSMVALGFCSWMMLSLIFGDNAALPETAAVPIWCFVVISILFFTQRLYRASTADVRLSRTTWDMWFQFRLGLEEVKIIRKKYGQIVGLLCYFLVFAPYIFILFFVLGSIKLYSLPK